MHTYVSWGREYEMPNYFGRLKFKDLILFHDEKFPETIQLSQKRNLLYGNFSKMASTVSRYTCYII